MQCSVFCSKQTADIKQKSEYFDEMREGERERERVVFTGTSQRTVGLVDDIHPPIHFQLLSYQLSQLQ